MPYIWGRMSGQTGKVEVPSVGAVIGIMRQWSISRSEESDQGNPGRLTLRASFSYVNESLMNEDAVKKVVTIDVRRDKHYRVVGERMAFDGTTLVIEGAELCRPED